MSLLLLLNPKFPGTGAAYDTGDTGRRPRKKEWTEEQKKRLRIVRSDDEDIMLIITGAKLYDD